LFAGPMHPSRPHRRYSGRLALVRTLARSIPGE
jgi:hypothetical protein